jgi:CubicO group peptidase (beta-lactamase class C family)
MTYFPPPHPAPWTTATPVEAGLDPAALAAAARHARECETPWSRDLVLMVTSDFQECPPWNETLGPVRPRGGPNGLVLRGGRIVAEWGETTRVDMTFSVAKSYLAILAGLAWDRGLIRDPHEAVCRTVEDGGFEAPHNDAITWHHLLQQTSEWEGVLWDKPDLVDRNRSSAGRPSAAPKGTHRDLQRPGGFWEYNDVRVNRLSLALLRIWRRPLPEVFRELVMDPIGASPDWQWVGYRNSWVEIGGTRVQSVSGGGHWGGGVFISARDQARIGQMLLACGMWESRRILSEAWIERMLDPCPLHP